MPTFYDSKGNAYVLAREIGRGGEGTVYFCEGNSELVAKIYHEPISDEKAEKLRLMAENKNSRLLRVAAWVVETLHDKPNGRTVGFLMASIKAKEIHELYSLKSRRIHFPEATWHYLVHTATNLARAFYSLHRDSHVIGDVNHGNCVVLADGTVKLIDCDSYAISNGDGKRFPCEVGVATHLAPELQKANLSEVERKPEHDNFALAIVIFQLLFLGRHPFAGNYVGEKDKTLEDCIREVRFAYGKNAKKLKVKQPPGTLRLNEVSPRITELFERAFDERQDNRPIPQEWVEALVDLSEKLAQCSMNPGHRFYNELLDCPWCRIESQTGLMLFPFVFSEEQTDGEQPFNIFTVEKLIENLGIQRNLPAVLPQPSLLALPAPSNETLETAKINRNNQFLYVGGYFLSLIIMIGLFGVVSGTFFGFMLMLYLYSSLSKGHKEMQTLLNENLSKTEEKWNELEKQWRLTASPQIFAGTIQEIRGKVEDYKASQIRIRKDVKLLERDSEYRALNDYLRKFRIENSTIEGISTKTREDLVKKKVWTAAEIHKNRLIDKYRLNSHETKILLEWRKELEKDFSYDTDNFAFKQRKDQLLDENRTRSRGIEKQIERSLESLRKRSVTARQGQTHLLPESEKLGKKILQYKSDLETVGDTSMPLVLLILITIIVPFFGGIISQVNSRHRYNASDSYSDDYSYAPPLPADNNNKDSFAYIGETLSDTEAAELEIPVNDITDEEISDLSDTTRKNFSDNLVRQAIHIVKTFQFNEVSIQKRDGSVNSKSEMKADALKEADSKVRLALRIRKNNIYAFEEFGKTLYDETLYKDSLEFFNLLKRELSDQIYEYKNQQIFALYIGKNQIGLKQYKKARETLLDMVSEYPSTEAYFELGLAYKGLVDYEKAAKSFEYAIQMDPKDINSHYELGYIYFKLKDKEAFNRQYAELLDIDAEKAEELLENSYKLLPKVKIKPIDGGGFGTGEGVGRGSGGGVGSGFGTGEGSGSGPGIGSGNGGGSVAVDSSNR